MSRCGLIRAALVTCLALATSCAAGEVRRNEEVTFFPTAAYREGAGWIIPIRGWLYEPKRDSFKRWAAIKLLEDALDIEGHPYQQALFSRRVRKFMVDDVEGRRLAVQAAGREWLMNASDRDGYFSASVRLTDADAGGLAVQHDGRRWIEYRARTDPGDARQFAGQVELIDPTGYSVISDIDDTIKITEVSDKEESLENTFLKPFRPVPGMADVYRGWERDGASFHYVSASPWQLYEELADFLVKRDFPAGSFQLKHLSLRRLTTSDLFESPTGFKLRVIEELMGLYPQRKFVLVGDSGQDDPEVYGELYRRHPDQVVFIAIRGLGGKKDKADRYDEALKGLPSAACQVFEKPGDLKPTLTALP